VDPSGRRRLPIHDEAHVRNALARFDQVSFHDDAARAQARIRLLRAAKKYGIVPIGFIDRQLRGQASPALPSGAVTFLLTDIEDSTGLVRELGDGYATILADVRRLVRSAVRRAGGQEVDARADEYFAVFKATGSAVAAAISVQRAMLGHAWPSGAQVKLRVGIHAGRPTLTDSGYVGLAVHATQRVSATAHGGQVVLSRAAARSVADDLPDDVQLVELGTYRLKGMPEPETLFQLHADGLPDTFPPPRLPEGARA
jgi:class 3 adenylate cyclase